MAGSRFATNRIIVAAVELHSIPPQMIVSVGPLGPSHGPGECLSACSKAAGHSELESKRRSDTRGRPGHGDDRPQQPPQPRQVNGCLVLDRCRPTLVRRLEARRTDGDGHRRHTVSGLVNEVGQSVFDHVRATVRDSLLRAHEQDWCGRSTGRRVFRLWAPRRQWLLSIGCYTTRRTRLPASCGSRRGRQHPDRGGVPQAQGEQPPALITTILG